MPVWFPNQFSLLQALRAAGFANDPVMGWSRIMFSQTWCATMLTTPGNGQGVGLVLWFAGPA